MAAALYTRRAFLGTAITGMVAAPAVAQVADQRSPNQLHEPLYRVSKANIDSGGTPQGHPLDPALVMAREALINVRQNIHDYQTTLVKREQINGVVNDYEYIFTKVRNRKVREGQVVVPLSVYMYFLKPVTIKGREVVFVEGQNENKMMAHEGGTRGRFIPSLWLNPTGPVAMSGQRYPLTEVGIENLIVKLIDRGELDRKLGPCEVKFHQNAKINGRVCTVLEVKHEERNPEFDFHLAQVFIDDEYNVPIRYAAYNWPASPGGKPEVIEEYTYLDLKLNVGLSEQDFDHRNPAYNFVRQKT